MLRCDKSMSMEDETCYRTMIGLIRNYDRDDKDFEQKSNEFLQMLHCMPDVVFCRDEEV